MVACAPEFNEKTKTSNVSVDKNLDIIILKSIKHEFMTNYATSVTSLPEPPRMISAESISSDVMG